MAERSTPYQPNPYFKLEHPEWTRSATTYQPNTGQFTIEGTVRGSDTASAQVGWRPTRLAHRASPIPAPSQYRFVTPRLTWKSRLSVTQAPKAPPKG
jgi:hypothetical protein